jgi:hypothetical protein
MTPYLRVALAANAAKKRYCPFTVGDVMPERWRARFISTPPRALAVFPIEVWREDDEVHVVFDREFQARMVLGRQANCEFYLEKVRYAAAMVSHNAFIQACTRSKPLRTSVLPLYCGHIWP